MMKYQGIVEELKGFVEELVRMWVFVEECFEDIIRSGEDEIHEDRRIGDKGRWGCSFSFHIHLVNLTVAHSNLLRKFLCKSYY